MYVRLRRVKKTHILGVALLSIVAAVVALLACEAVYVGWMFKHDKRPLVTQQGWNGLRELTQNAIALGKQGFTGYPPAVYMQPFIACAADKPCTRTDEFRVDLLPKGCCVLTVRNGDGRGTDEVRSYEVFLNGERVLPAGGARYADKPITLQTGTNNVRVVLVGEPHSKIFVLVAYDPRQSK
jgi:hypothetical protein